MKITAFSTYHYEIPLTTGQLRKGLFIKISDDQEHIGWGEVAPLPNWSRETLEEAFQQLKRKHQQILERDWNAENCLQEIDQLKLLPSVSFGLESALFSLLTPLSNYNIAASALLMGSAEEILAQAQARHEEGYRSAKLKVSNLSSKEASEIIHQLKDRFSLRIDVNRAWEARESLRFFSQFPLDTFDYVEEPFQNSDNLVYDLAQFPHPLAIDESYPNNLSLKQLESLSTLKALIYKPTIQGGVLGAISLCEWAAAKGIEVVLSSSFESDIGLAFVASVAKRLSLRESVGIGTYHFLSRQISTTPLKFSNGVFAIPAKIIPKLQKTN